MCTADVIEEDIMVNIEVAECEEAETEVVVIGQVVGLTL